jgi:hypothetical protein
MWLPPISQQYFANQTRFVVLRAMVNKNFTAINVSLKSLPHGLCAAKSFKNGEAERAIREDQN